MVCWWVAVATSQVSVPTRRRELQQILAGTVTACSAGSHLLLEIYLASTYFPTEALSAILRNVSAAVDFWILIEAERIGLLAAEKSESNVGAVQILTASVKYSDSAFYSKLHSGGFSTSSALDLSLACHTRKIGFDQSGSSHNVGPESLRVGRNSGSLTERMRDTKLDHLASRLNPTCPNSRYFHGQKWYFLRYITVPVLSYRTTLIPSRRLLDAAIVSTLQQLPFQILATIPNPRFSKKPDSRARVKAPSSNPNRLLEVNGACPPSWRGNPDRETPAQPANDAAHTTPQIGVSRWPLKNSKIPGGQRAEEKVS